MGKSDKIPYAFTILLSGEAFSLLGSQISLVMIPLLAVLTLHSTAFVMGLIGVFGWLPIILCGLFAGVIIDRLDTKKVLIYCNISRFILLGMIPLAYIYHFLSIPLLLMIVFITGIANVFFDIALQTFIPEIVPEQKLSQANSRLEFYRAVAQIGGPILAGLLAVRCAPAKIISLDALSFFIAFLALFYMPQGMHRMQIIHSEQREGTWNSELIAGLIEVWKSSQLRLMILSGVSINIGVAGIEVLLILFLKLTLDFNATIIGISLASMGIGSLLGALGYQRWTRLSDENIRICLSIGIIVLGGLLLPLSAYCLPIICVILAQFLLGFGSTVLNITLVTLRQRITPAALLGRVNAAARVSIMSSLPLGSFLGEILAQSYGIINTLWCAGMWQILVLMTVSPLWLKLRARQRLKL